MKTARLSTRGALFFVLMLSATTGSHSQVIRVDKVRQLYDSIKAYQLESPETVLASAIFETGWLQCKDCSLEMNNLFGFRITDTYITFSNTSECLAYMKKWQEAFYKPWRAKHSGGTYYEFLCYVKYAADMPFYVKNVKSLETWIKTNISPRQPELSDALFVQNIR